MTVGASDLIPLLLTLALPTDESAVWRAAGFLDAQIQVVDLSAPPTPQLSAGPTHFFDATAVVYRDIGWTESEILARAIKTARIYQQCRVQLRRLKIVTAGAPGGNPDCGWTDGGDERVAGATPETARPILYFARHNRDGNYAYAWRHSVTAVGALRNTAWFSRAIDEDPAFDAQIQDKSYEVLAHELGHLLIDSGHVTDGSSNLMAEDADLVNGTLTPEQCERIRHHASVHSY